MTYRNPALLKLAKGAPCMSCGCQDGTIVAAHSNMLQHDRGHAHKSHDGAIAFLCHGCHFEYDHGKTFTREEKTDMFLRACVKTYMWLWDQELIQVSK